MIKTGSGRALKVEKKDSRLFENSIVWLSTKEAAHYLRTSAQQIRNWVYQGKIKSYKLGRKLLFKRSDLDAALKLQGGW